MNKKSSKYEGFPPLWFLSPTSSVCIMIQKDNDQCKHAIIRWKSTDSVNEPECSNRNQEILQITFTIRQVSYLVGYKQKRHF